MSYQGLDEVLVKDILGYLRCPQKAPTLRHLNQLIYAYIRKVPWESVSRIIKRRTTLDIKDCPRLPEEFWKNAMQYGFGGTCYESSLAFYSLLMALGYEGYLTVNDMGNTRGCHAAIVLLLNKQKYLVDITIPVHVAVRITPNRIVRRNISFLNFTIRPVQDNKYEVERSHHPHRNAFTLIDMPISPSEYQRILEDDYLESTGLFLQTVVIVKLIGDKTWRFVKDQESQKLEIISRSGKTKVALDRETLTNSLARLFQMPESKISAALVLIQKPGADSYAPSPLLVSAMESNV